ncbi:MAG: nuclear transport factor 2 family protein [Paludibacterium sp.]|uniref:nuclear transport factor 2 family protein n=1 Tax=Paludibacterium sp. TaxID=1917523 RepID=UPI0025F3AE93|nr:nuclear transport factor 2 family protein [Paludibacterium sp.]MBV8048853.1 nuclear transport factor 2 family protein [Paludibacterium sp.]
MDLRQIVVDALQAVLCRQADPADYFSPDYRQQVDGRLLDYAAFTRHLDTLRQHVATFSIRFDQLIVEADKVVSVHYPTIVKHDGTRAEYKVIAIFTVAAGRIVRCEELTYMLEGEPQERDLGSR